MDDRTRREQAFADLAALFPEPVALVRQGGEIVAVNQALATLLGHPRPALAGRPLQEIAATPPAELAAYLGRAAGARQLALGGLELRGIDGTSIRCRAEAGPVVPRAGEAEALLVLRLTPRHGTPSAFAVLNQQVERLGHEVGRRTRSEDALRAQREWLHVTLTSIGDAVVATDPAGAIAWMNPAAEALTGWQAAEALGRPAADVIRLRDEQTGDDVEACTARVARGETSLPESVPLTLVARDGSLRPVSENAAPIQDARGRAMGVVLVLRDVTAQRRAEEATRQAIRAKDEFLATLSHELRTPLNAMLGWARVLAAGQVDAATLARGLAAIERNALAQAGLIEDLLDLTRVVSGRLTIEAVPVQLAPLVESVADSVRVAADAKQIGLQVHLTPDLPPVAGDADRLHQVASNLLSNAVKFTPPGGHVTVWVTGDADGVELGVRDTGVGIEPAFLPKVFERFTQWDGSTTRGHGGLGLGLAIARHLVELHGGTIEARSDGPGRGAEFVVRLPAAGMDAALEVAAFAAPPAADGDRDLAGLRVLLVEDDLDGREVGRVILEGRGARVETAGSVDEALQAFDQAPPDVVVTDIGMPERDGFQLLAALKQRFLNGAAPVPVAALTGFAHRHDADQALHAGFDAHLAKPVDPDALAATIRRLCGHSV